MSFLTRHSYIYFYVPNLIGYARIAFFIYSLWVAFSDPIVTILTYFLSFVCDELDGRVARLFNQTSTFGAVLDMVTDRVATAGLQLVLAVIYPECYLFFVLLILLDIFSHWFQMYSTLLNGSSTHKDIKSGSWLVRTYYKNRIFMGFCCVCCEVLYLLMYTLRFPLFNQWRIPHLRVDLPPQFRPYIPVLGSWLNGEDMPIAAFLGFVAIPGVTIKQLCNFVQLKNAANELNAYDLRKSQ